MANTKITSRVIADDAILTANIADDQITSALIADDVALGGNPTTSTQTAGNNTTRIATTAFVSTAVANIVNSAPATLDTLGEIATALNNDAALNTTLTNSIAAKLPLAGGTMTGTIAGFTSTGIDDNADATAITIDSSERVNIGKTSAVSGHPIEIQANASGQGLGIYGRSSDDFSFLGFYENGANTEKVSLRSDGGALAIKTSGTEALRIDSSGNVGIGTSSPDAILEVDGSASTDGILITNPLSGSFYNAKLEFKRDGTSGGAKIQTERDSAGGVGLSFNYTASNTAEVNGTYSEAMRIDESGNVGIGTTSPDSALHIKDSGDTVLVLEGGASDANCRINFQNSGGTFRGMLSYDTDDNNLQFNVNDAERMRIDSSGNLIIGHTSTSVSGLNALAFRPASGALMSRNTTSSANHIIFQNPNGAVGSIATSGSATAFNTSSDYRLKENIVTDWDATSLLKQLKPSKFNFKADADTTLQGFLAHEVSSIVPQAVTGEKDAIYTAEEAVDDIDAVEGQPKYQSIDQSKLVPLLVKTIQEQQTIIEDLKARIETLEG